MATAYLVDGIRTPIGKYAGALSATRPDDLAAFVIRALLDRLPKVAPEAIDDVILGCANQAGEDNRNIARMSLLLAGLPASVPGLTVNRLCASGMAAVAVAANGIGSGSGDLYLAGGLESMSRAPFVLGKAEKPFARAPELFDTTLGWRFINRRLQKLYGTDSMGETAENVARDYSIARNDQDVFALRSQQKAAAAAVAGQFAREILSVSTENGELREDEALRPETTLEKLAALKPAFRADGSVTAGNSSGLNDGACAVLIASENAVKRFDLQPKARFVGAAVAGVEPRVMGIGPVPATEKLLSRLNLSLGQFGVIELNEAFAAQGLASLRALRIADDDPRVNRLGGAIALGHPLGMSGARLVLTALHQLRDVPERYALCTMCVGVGQGMSCVIERV